MKTKTSKQKAQAAMRDWLKAWGIVLSPVVAADLVSRVEAAIQDERRAVLTRLREPTPGMVGKGAGYADFGFNPAVPDVESYNREIAMVFRAMIDAAMEEPPAPP